MKTSVWASVVTCGLLGLLLAKPVAAGDEPGLTAKAAFDRMKSLAGEWTSETQAGKPAEKVVYRVISNGSVVMETLFPGTNHEMVSMYHLDGGELRMTHYCAIGNQPRLKLDKAASKPDELHFVFDGGTNLDPARDSHMHSARISFRDARHVEAEWEAYAGGKRQDSKKLAMQRP